MKKVDNLASRCAWAIKIIPKDKNLDKGITDVSLAKILDTDKNTLARYRKEKGLLAGKVIDNLISHYKFNPMWLFKGEGEPFPGARIKYPEVCVPVESSDVYETIPAYGGVAQKINIDEAQGKAYRVLSAGTALSVALYMNIQQFAAALDTGQELKVCQDQMKDMQGQINELNNKVDRLTAVPTTVADPIAGSEEKGM